MEREIVRATLCTVMAAFFVCAALLGTFGVPHKQRSSSDSNAISTSRPVNGIQAWTASVYHSPSYVYISESNSVTITISNSMSQPMLLTDVFVHFAWQLSNYGYYYLQSG